jgi:predicted class III extradiol MEMO1 family dioxygenase
VKAIEKLKEDGKWTYTNKQDEEDEHSLEMHLPYIKKIFEG